MLFLKVLLAWCILWCECSLLVSVTGEVGEMRGVGVGRATACTRLRTSTTRSHRSI